MYIYIYINTCAFVELRFHSIIATLQGANEDPSQAYDRIFLTVPAIYLLFYPELMAGLVRSTLDWLMSRRKPTYTIPLCKDPPQKAVIFGEARCDGKDLPAMNGNLWRRNNPQRTFQWLVLVALCLQHPFLLTLQGQLFHNHSAFLSTYKHVW